MYYLANININNQLTIWFTSVIILLLNFYIRYVIKFCIFTLFYISKLNKAKNMPIYDFACTSCGFKDELMRKISQPSQTTCPKCSKETFAKMLSAPSFQLSGTGWYASDFKDKKPKNNEITAEKNTEKTEAKTAETTTTTTAATCNPGCACH